MRRRSCFSNRPKGKRSLPPRLVLASIAVAALTPVHATELSALRWRSRPVVVLADSRDDPRVAKQMEALRQADRAITDRNIEVRSEVRKAGPLHRGLGVADGFAVVLVGKDGEVKRVWRDFVRPRDIFGVIDAMPMRRQEMRLQGPAREDRRG